MALTVERRRSVDAFDVFVVESAPTLLRLALSLTLTGAGTAYAEDLVQESLLVTWRHWESIATAPDAVGYARRVLVNKFIDGERRRRRLREAIPSLSRMDEAQFHKVQTTDSVGSSVTESEALRAALRELPRVQRAAVVLHYLHDLDHATIGDMLGIGPSSARSSTSRAITKIKRAMLATT